MQFYQQITDGLYRLGVNDRRISRFENMFPIPNGISYNTYLLTGEKTVLLDTVDACYISQFLDNLEGALQGRDLDYMIVSHMEPDHSSAITTVLMKYPNCEVITNAKGKQLLEQFYKGAEIKNLREVKDLEVLDIGNRKLTFYFAPMVHWPEVMMVMTDRGEFFTADAFGSFGAIEGHIFSDTFQLSESNIDEIRRYYTNIVGKHGRSVEQLLNKVKDCEINMILPLHGTIHRTPDRIQFMLEKYTTWAKFEKEEDGVLIAFASMYENTQLAADILAYYLAEEGVEHIRVMDVSGVDQSYLVGQAHRFSNMVVTALNYNAELYPNMDAFLRDLVATGYKNRKISYITNLSWGGRAIDITKSIFEKANLTEVGDLVTIKSSATDENIEQLKELAKAIKESLQ